MPFPQIPIHAFAAMAAFVLGLVQFAAPKGTLPHRTLGWIWVTLMATVAVSSFWIHQIRLVGPWSPIHLLSIFTLVMLPLAVWRAHRHQVADHRRIMILLFTGALVDRRTVHAAAGTDHARGRVWSTLEKPASEYGSGGLFWPRKRGRPSTFQRPVRGAAARTAVSRVSLWKNEGKKRLAGIV